MTLTVVVAVGGNGVIGRDGDLPWEPTGDLVHFKQLTMGGVLVMGRRTYDSIGRPLPGRRTVVVTRDRAWSPEEVHVASDIDGALGVAADLGPEVFVVGGAQVYAQTLGRADRLVVTHVHQSPPGDTYLPQVDWSQWRETERAAHDGFDIVTYVRPSAADGGAEESVEGLA